MIVIGVGVHKQSLTAVAVDEAGRMLSEVTVRVGSDELLGWAADLSEGRLWALEDCRRLTRWLERQLLASGEELVRVPPKLRAPERRSGRGRGKSDPIDALAVARAALREPDLGRPRADEEPFRELKLLVDHRDAIVDERRRIHQRLPWHLHQLDPSFVVPLRMLARKSHLERVSRWLARQDQELQVRLARELVASCRSLARAITALDQERAANRGARAGAARAAWLRCSHGSEVARRDRPHRTLPKRRSACSAQRRCAVGSKLRTDSTTSPRPRRQPPTQRRAPPHRDHPSPLSRRRSRLPRP
jgi:transposase